MKKLLFLIGILFLSHLVNAQTVGLSYQAVISKKKTERHDKDEHKWRDRDDYWKEKNEKVEYKILENKAIYIRFSVQNSTGLLEYQEEHQTRTDPHGMINLIIGQGETTGASPGVFFDIDWDGTPKDLKVEIRLVKKGGGYEDFSLQQLTYVPYGHHRNITATGTMEIEGQTDLNSDLNVNGESATNLSGSLNVVGISNLNSDLTVAQGSATFLTGAVTIDGITTLNNDLTIADGNKLTLSGDLEVSGGATLDQLVVRGSGGADNGHVALFENSAGGDGDGIAIRINKDNTSRENNFVTFYDNNKVTGRIEGFDITVGDTFNDFPIPDFSDFFNIADFNNVLVGGQLPSLSVTGGTLPSASFGRGSLPSASFSVSDGLSFSKGSLPWLSFTRGSFPTSSFNVGAFPTVDFTNFFNPTPLGSAGVQIAAMVGWGYRTGNPGFIPTSAKKIALAAVILAAKQAAQHQGTIYGSKGADYAEWLEKEDINEKFVFGEVVGVWGGKISKVTEGADQVMSISMAPIVLGNMPEEDKVANYEKVGFMGQVPVLVKGLVKVGDYIVASGDNDGYAVAKTAGQLEVDDLKSVIGKAWESSNELAGLINVSVGLKTNEWVDIFKKQEQRIVELESEASLFESRLEKIEKSISSEL